MLVTSQSYAETREQIFALAITRRRFLRIIIHGYVMAHMAANLLRKTATGANS